MNHPGKNIVRRQLLQQRQALPLAVWRTQSEQICHHLLNCAEFIAARTILAYHSHHQEPSLEYLFTNTDKQWGLPRISTAEAIARANAPLPPTIGKNLLWHRWQPLEPLVVGKYGILEPQLESPLLEPDCVDLILVPAVAMDLHGYRLGYGGGYYDRLRSNPLWRKISTIGIVFDFAYVEQLPIEAWDLPLDAVCTELGVNYYPPLTLSG